MNIVAEKIAVLLLLAAVGAAVGWFRRITQEGIELLSLIVTDVTMPLLSFSVLATGERELLLALWFVPLFAVGVILAGAGAGWLLTAGRSVPPAVRMPYIQASAFANTGFLAIPLLYTLYGKAGASCAVVFNIGYSLCWWSLGIYLLQRIRQERASIHPGRMVTFGLVASLAGLVVGLAQLRIPSVILETATLIGEVTIPLAMIALGLMLSRNRSILPSRPGLLVSVSGLRLVLLPLAAWLCVRLFPGMSHTLRVSLVLLAGMPCASSAPLFVDRYGGDASFAVSAVVVTTVTGLITIPVWISFLGR